MIPKAFPSASISKICSETLSQCFTLWMLVERWNSHLEEKLPCRCTAHMISMVITWMSVRFGKKSHGNRKLQEAKPCRVWTVVSTILLRSNPCDLIIMTYLHLVQVVTTVQFITWPRAISSEPVQFQVNPCNFKWTRAISSELVQFQVNLCNFKWTRAISSEPVQFQVNPCNFKWTRAISSEPVQFQVNPCNFKWTRAISSEPVQFQVNPCNFKWTRAISSELVQFQNNCTISAYGFCIVVGNSPTIRKKMVQ